MSGRYAGTYIPLFDLADRFCYFLDLNDPKEDEASDIAVAKQDLFKKAQAKISNGLSVLDINQTSQASNEITNAIKFLDAVAKSERDKEIRVIKKYYDQIKKDPLISTWLTSKKHNRLNTLLTDLQNYSNNPSATNNMDWKEFYSTMIMLLTSIRSDSERFKQRLEVLAKQDRDSWQKIADDDIIFRQAGDLDTLLRSAIGIQQREKETGFNKYIMDNLLTFLEKKLKINKLFLEHPYSAIVAIMLDFENFIKSHYAEIMSKKSAKEREKAIKELWDKYESEEDSFIVQLEQETQYALTTLQEIEKYMGFSELKKTEEAYQKRLEILQKVRNSKTKDRRNKIREFFAKVQAQDPSQATGIKASDSELFTWTATTGKNGQHGIIYEIAKKLEEHATKIGSSAGTDLLLLDLAHVNIRTARQQKHIEHALVESGKIGLRRRNRKQDLGPAYAKVSDEIAAATTKLNEMLQKNNIPDDIFIYHESLKLYITVETGASKEFGGRELAILNALDSLFTATQLQSNYQKVLYAAALNLSKYAVGANLQDPIENYLSIFAGLLMFDDIKNMAQEAANGVVNQVSQGQALNIHLYLVNDFYIPGSFLLTTMADAMKKGYHRVSASSGDWARVTISTSDANDTISSYLAERASGVRKYYMRDWRHIGNKVASGTKMKIHFLTGFANLIESLQNYIKT